MSFSSFCVVTLLAVSGVTTLVRPPLPGKIRLANASAVALTDKPVTLSRAKLGNAGETKLFPLVLDDTRRPLPVQLDDTDGDGRWDDLLMVVDLPAKSSRTFQLSWIDTLTTFPVRARVRFGKRSSQYHAVQPIASDNFYAHELPIRLGYQPYQTDGPTWENDKAGFRHYLDGRNAKDLFGKRTPAMSPDQVGLTATGAVVDNYHVLHDWGRDVLPAGNTEGLSLGLGGVGLLIGDELHRIGVMATDSTHTVEQTSTRVMASGPLKAALSIDYQHWKPRPDRDYQLRERPTIWPGYYAYQNTVSLPALQGDETLLIGLSHVATTKPPTVFKQDGWVALYTVDQQSYNREYWLGLAILVPDAQYLGWADSPAKGPVALTYYAKLRLSANQPLTYYAMGGWELADPGFRDEAYVETYLKSLIKQLTTPVTITFSPDSRS